MNVLIQNNDTNLFTTVQPNRDKETVILLHGGPGVPEGLTFIIEYLKKNFQVISFHQRGTLMSPATDHDYSLDSYISDISRITDYFELQKFHLFGHSWGGLYAQLYAQKNHDRILSLFLCSPGSGTGKQWKEGMIEIAKYNKAKCSILEWSAMIINAALGGLGSDKGYRSFYRQALQNFSRGFHEAHLETFAIDCIMAKAINHTNKNILTHPLLPEMPNLGFKITITYGDNDIIGNSKKYVRQRYPTAAIIPVPASGHIPWSHNNRAFVKILEQHYSL